MQAPRFQEELGAASVPDAAEGSFPVLTIEIVRTRKMAFWSLEITAQALAVVQVDGAPIRLQLCDTAGQDEFDMLRQVCYPKAEIFLLCFSVVAPTSFQNVADKWYPEVRRHCPSTPVLLVGTQSDLRQDVKVLIALARRREKPVAPSAARALSLKLGMVGYLECSALTQHNLKEVFDTAIAAGLRHADHPGPKARRGPASCLRTLSKAWWRKCVCVR
ncbi:hypothetical protein JD844_005819 [Phrynosoma platyrhinos]|uniref:Rho-related GTP-binding protein RhoU n=1 Tax=Phrynosoma platyrhinos TaxID=52577 RepID=A0ABQ7TNV9_PHRPL|nr:hypothetical protein JD844_005819 [Phrynosoma platyrhinos]